jgi:hypothetical protein
VQTRLSPSNQRKASLLEGARRNRVRGYRVQDRSIRFRATNAERAASQSAGQPDPRCRRGRDSGSIREGAGSQPFHPGARSEGEIGDFLVGLGLERMDELRIGPGPSMALLDFVEKIVSGELFSACSGILSSQVEGMVREDT